MHSPDTPLHQFGNATPPEVVGPPLIENFAFDDPVKEEQFQQAWHVLQTSEDPRARPSWLLFAIIVGIATFVMFEGGQVNIRIYALLAGVIMLHELGHFLGMKLFGYTDGKLFLIPLFALAVRGKRHAAPAWQQASTILLGPLPGLLMALSLYLLYREESPAWMLRFVVLLMFINGINLLPLAFADTGRLLNLLIYSRNAWLETLTHLISVALFGFVAYWQHAYVLGVLAVTMLLTTPTVFRMGRMTTRLRREGLQMPDTVAELDPLHGRMLFAAAYDIMGPANASTRATLMRQLHDRVLVPAPGLLATASFLLLYLIGWIAVISTIGLIGADVHDLQLRLVAPQWQPEYQWKKEAIELRRKARRLRGPAREAALKDATRLEEHYDQWIRGLRTRLGAYQDAVWVLGGPPANPGGDDEDDEQEKDHQ